MCGESRPSSRWLLPHGDRLRRRLIEDDTPVLLLWALPGSGRRRVMVAWGAEERAVGSLAASAAASPARLRQALGRGRRQQLATWICDGWAPAAVSLLLAELRPGERIVASVERLPAEATTDPRVSVVGPGEWLLTRREAGALDERLRSGDSPPASEAATTAEELHALTGGWLRPLELALTTGSQQRDRPLEEREPIRSFLQQVAASLTTEERRFLAEGGAVDDGGRLAAVARHHPGPVRLLAPWASPGGHPPATGASRRVPPRAEAAAFDVRLLGPPEVASRSGGEPLAWPYRKVVSLLSLLLLEPDRTMTQERVAEALWPDRPFERARANLDPTVSHLRRWLAGGRRLPAADSVVLLRDRVYRLHPEWSFRLDVEEFESLVARAAGLRESRDSESRLEILERARGLYRGPLLDGFRGSWMRERRRRLAARHRLLLRELGDLYSSVGRTADAEDSYRTILAVEPLEEEVHVAIMRLYARQGREDLVRRQFEKLATLLARELGIQPMDETLREVQRLLGRA